MRHHFVDWPYRAVTRIARLLRRQGRGLARPYVNIESYPKQAALFLIKETLKSWLLGNPGFYILIGGPGARAPNVQTTRYYARCFEEIKFRNIGRSCVIESACNAGYLLLGDSKALYMSQRFVEVARRASKRC